jgi:ABC-type glycerol-3-phosphate transport system substrate-binding protein
MRGRTRTAGAVSAAALLTCILAGASSVNAEDVTIRFTSYSQERLEFYKQAAEEFKKEFPNITVVPETLVEDDYNQALPLSFRSRNSPDIFVYTTPTAGEYFELADLLANEWIAPLDKSVLPADFGDRFPGTNGLGSPTYGRDGNIYTIPRPPSTGALGYGYMYYSKDVVAAAGLTDKLPKSWDEFKAACEAIKVAGKYCFASPSQGPDEVSRLLTVFMGVSVPGYRDTGPSVEKGDFSQILQPDFVEALQYLRSLYEAGYVVPGSYDKVAARQAVANGEAAFYFDGGWMSTVFPEVFQFSNFGVALPPGKTGAGKGTYTALIGQGPPMPENFISSQSVHVKEATQFLEWMTRPDGWFTKAFSEKGFDALPWVSETQVAEWVPASNPAHDLFALSPEVHVLAPQPSLKCPDLAKSKAVSNVDNIRPEWVHSAEIDFLLNGGDWLAIAQPIVDEQNRVFKETLDAEAASGLKVSMDCYAEPNWDGLTPFGS